MAHVLVVNDDKSICQMLREMLSLDGHAVTVARDGHEGLAVLRSSLHPLIVLLDVIMWEMDGIEMLRLVAADERAARMHSYLVTQVFPGVEERLREVAPSEEWGLLPTPFTTMQLTKALVEAEVRLPKR